MILQNVQNLPITDKKKQLFLFFIGWLGLVIAAFIAALLISGIAGLILSPSALDLFLISEGYFTAINFLTYALIFSLMVYLLWPWLKSTIQLRELKGAWWLGIPFTFAILFSNILMISIYDVFGIVLESNQNQEAIISLVEATPFLSFITFVFLGPIVEEWTYRLGLFQYLKQKSRWLAYGITLLLFGLIHFDFSAPNLTNELLNLPLYSVAGAWFCFLYDRYGLKVAMTAHIFNNFLSVIAILIPVTELVSSSL